MSRWMSTNSKVHTVTLIRPSPGWWKWHCSCGRESTQRFGYPGKAEAAGAHHARMLNERTEGSDV